MVVCIFVYSQYCPNCELFKYGYIEREFHGKLIRFHGLGKGVKSAYEIVKDVCTAVGIPFVDMDISQVLGWGEDEAYTLYIPEVSERGFRRRFLSRTTYRYWIFEWFQKDVIELPSFLIKSSIARDRHVNVEIALSDPAIPLDWSASRQVLRELARTAIEEQLILMGLNSYELRELLLQRLFPVNETGETDVLAWIRGFIQLKHLKMRYEARSR